MPRPTITEGLKYYTSTEALEAIGLTREEFNRRLDQGVLPKPTTVNGVGLRLFDDAWIKKAKHIVGLEKHKQAQRARNNHK